MHQPKSQAQSKGEDIADFIASYNYQQIIIDQIIDKRIDQVRCKEVDEQCNIY